jgi:hypothetical protein
MQQREDDQEKERGRHLTATRSDTCEYHLGLEGTIFLPGLPTEVYYRRVSMLLGHDVEK